MKRAFKSLDLAHRGMSILQLSQLMPRVPSGLWKNNHFRIKKTTIFIAAMLLAVMSNAQVKADAGKAVKETNQPSKWTNDVSHSSIRFMVTHLMVSEVEGRFKTFSGTVDAPTADFNNAVVSFTVDVNSITTEDDTRDKHLKNDDFFNVEKFPKMTFRSTSFKKVSGNKYVMEGNLTIRDVTKKVKFDVTYGGTITDPWGNIKAGFKATSAVSRKDFNLRWNALTEAGGAVVSDKVNILLNLEFAKQKQ